MGRDERRFAIGNEGWCVWEDIRGPFDRSLIFENEKTARRVRDYPKHWQTLSDEQLYVLSWSR